eukprot:jgi/Tetstr1/421538/TSEL_012485.t1
MAVSSQWRWCSQQSRLCNELGMHKGRAGRWCPSSAWARWRGGGRRDGMAPGRVSANEATTDVHVTSLAPKPVPRITIMAPLNPEANEFYPAWMVEETLSSYFTDDDLKELEVVDDWVTMLAEIDALAEMEALADEQA